MSVQRKRDNNISEALRYYGLSVMIKSKDEFKLIWRYIKFYKIHKQHMNL